MYGFEGLTISCYNAMGVFSKYIKLYELGYQSKIALALNIPHDLDVLRDVVEGINVQTLLPEAVVLLIRGKSITTAEQDLLRLRLKTDLVVPGDIIVMDDQDVGTIMTEYLKTSSDRHVAYVNDYRLLNNTKFFKQCKTGILHGKPIFKSKIYSKSSTNLSEGYEVSAISDTLVKSVNTFS